MNPIFRKTTSLLSPALDRLRNLNAWLLAGLLLLLWPKMQLLLETFTDPKTAFWLPLGNPASKIMLTLWVVAIGFAFVWLGLHLNHTTLRCWAKANFKATFNYLPASCKLKYFTIYWFGTLFFFALIWLGASLIA